MGWSGGTYRKGNYASNGWTGDASLGIGIEASRHDDQDDDFETGINTCLTKDGTNTATGNLPMGGFKHLNIANATARNHYAAAGQVQDSAFIWCGTSAGTANAQTLAPTPAITAYAAGQVFRFIAGFTPTSTLTIAVSGLAAKSVLAEQLGEALGSIAFYAGMICDVIYNGTSFVLRNGFGSNIQLASFSADASSRFLQFFKSRGTSYPTSTIVAADDAFGVINFWGANGTGYDRAAFIAAFVDGTPGASNDMPSRITFATAPDGSATAVERMRLKSTGQLIIGQTTTAFTEEILAAGTGTGGQIVSVNGGSSGTGGGGNLTIRNGATAILAIGGRSAINGGAYDATPQLYFNATPKVQGISSGVGDRFMKWSTTTNAWTYDTSSARFKENIADLHYGLETVKQLRSREFDYLGEDARRDIGFIAEEVVNVVPEIVGLDLEGKPEAVMYDRLTSLLCKAIQELAAKVEALEAKVK
jgi:hypothetical protein